MKILLSESAYQLLTEGRVDVLREKYVKSDRIPNAIFNKFVEADPSASKEYVQWLCEIYLLGNLKLEDLYKATEYLEIYSKIRHKLSEKEKNLYALSDTKFKIEKFINKKGNEAERKIKFLEIDSLQMLNGIIEPFKQADEHLTVNEKLERDTLVFESPLWKVYIPKTHEQSCILGSGTEWCTATGKTDRHFNSYNSSGDLVILISKKNKKEKYQWHKPSDQFMDVRDNPTDILEVLITDEKLADWFIANKTLLHPVDYVHTILSFDNLFKKYKGTLKEIDNVHLFFNAHLIRTPEILDFYVTEVNFYGDDMYELLRILERCPVPKDQYPKSVIDKLESARSIQNEKSLFFHIKNRRSGGIAGKHFFYISPELDVIDLILRDLRGESNNDKQLSSYSFSLFASQLYNKPVSLFTDSQFIKFCNQFGVNIERDKDIINLSLGKWFHCYYIPTESFIFSWVQIHNGDKFVIYPSGLDSKKIKSLIRNCKFISEEIKNNIYKDREEIKVFPNPKKLEQYLISRR